MVDDRNYVINGPADAAPFTVFCEVELDTIILANGHLLSYSNLSVDDKSQLGILTLIEVCHNYGIEMLSVPTDLMPISKD